MRRYTCDRLTNKNCYECCEQKAVQLGPNFIRLIFVWNDVSVPKQPKTRLVLNIFESWRSIMEKVDLKNLKGTNSVSFPSYSQSGTGSVSQSLTTPIIRTFDQLLDFSRCDFNQLSGNCHVFYQLDSCFLPYRSGLFHQLSDFRRAFHTTCS